jgi:hypothetical protein
MVSLRASSPVLHKEIFHILTFTHEICDSDSELSWRRIAYVVAVMVIYSAKCQGPIHYLEPARTTATKSRSSRCCWMVWAAISVSKSHLNI